MSFTALSCPTCGTEVRQYRNPVPTVDIIIELNNGIVLIERKNEPLGWALPGGFVDYGETVEAAAIREAHEETSLDVHDITLLGCYSDPARDARLHTISVVFVATADGIPLAADDAINLGIFELDKLPRQLCFDHARIISDYIAWRQQRSN